MAVLGIDPGLNKFGVAVIDVNKKIIYREIQRLQDFDRQNSLSSEFIFNALAPVLQNIFNKFEVSNIALGDGTCSKNFEEALKKFISANEKLSGISVHVINEKHTTEAARALYLECNPPAFPMSLLPSTLVPVSVEVDDLAAAAIALKYLKEL
ncbi:MAG TPA: hypothetical protein PKK26_11540 [Candidatus Wallbacteria bacterium]|nr:hypothetical protein [Candidatus Wallbacteria bacterium]